MADFSEKYKRLYEQWLLKEAQQVIADLVAQNLPAPSLEDAKKAINMDPASQAKWKNSDEYKRIGALSKTATTVNRFSEMLTRRRAAAIREENPGTSEEDAFKQAEKDVENREANDRGSVSRSKDPFAAKILLDISNTLMDIAENVSLITEGLPDLRGQGTPAAPAVNTLRQEEENRERGGIKNAAVGVLKTAPDRIFGAFEKIFAILTPVLLGFLIGLTDLNDPLELVTDALIAFAAFIGGRFLYQLLKNVTIAAIMKLFTRTPTVPGTNIPGTGGINPNPNTPNPNPNPNTPNPSAPVDRDQRYGFLVKIANGIKDLGAGIGAFIASFFQGFATGIAAFANPRTIGGIAVIIGATAAIGGLAKLFKEGDLKPEDFITVGAGLVTLAGGLWALSKAIPAAAAITAGAKPLAIALGIVAAAILVIGASLIPGAYAFSLFGEALEKTTNNLSKLTKIDVDALYKVAEGLATFSAAMSLGTLATLAPSIFGADSPVDQVLDFAKKAKEAGLMEAAKSVDTLTSSLKNLNSLQLNNLDKVGEGIGSISDGIAKFSGANVISGWGNFIKGFLNRITGGTTPVEQIIKLAKDSSGIYQAGVGIQALGNGMVSFNSVDPKKVSETIKQVTSISEEQLKILSTFAVVGTQIRQMQSLERERDEVNEKQMARKEVPTEPQQPSINVAKGGDNYNNANYYGPPMQAEPWQKGMGFAPPIGSNCAFG